MIRLLFFISFLFVSFLNYGQCGAFFYSTNVGGATFQFTDSSWNASGNLNYSWDFGDSTNSALRNPRHTYNTSGTYTICLTISASPGCFDTYCDTVQVSAVMPPCTNSFTYFVDTLNNVSFTSNVSGTAPFTYTWNFGDGSPPSFQANPAHTYSNSGAYGVTLVVMDANRTVCTAYDTVYVNYCQAYFIATQGSNSATYNFKNYSSAPRTGVQYSWDFGDGSPLLNQKNASHTFNQSGNYLVTLSLNDTNNTCASTYQDSIQVSIPCQAGFTYSLNGNELKITNTASNYNNLIYYFGDGSSSSLPNPSHNYQQGRTYNVCQYVYGNNNCVDTFCVSINVTMPCSANFASELSKDTLFVTDLSQNADSIAYDFGDGTTSGLSNTYHIYSNSGTYNVCQFAYNTSTGCVSSTCTTTQVNVPRCQAKFTWQQTGDTVYFTNGGKNYNSLQYDFGDGTSSSLENPFHTYLASGTYVVTQTVLDVGRGCVDVYSDTLNITVSTSCVASFQIAIDTNLPGTVFVVNTSSNDNTHEYLWTFGDGSTSNIRLPEYRYQENLAHEVCLTVFDSILNCSSTFCDTFGLDSNGNIIKSRGYRIKVLEGDFIGIEETPTIQASFFPNPVNNVLNIEGINLLSPTEIHIRDINGKAILRSRLTENYIDLSNLRQGIYFLEIRQNEASIIRKIVKK